MLLVAVAAVVRSCSGEQALLINEIAILALFALSLDLILGYAGIVSLGHAAFFGVGAYAAALFAKHVMPDPLVGLVVGIALARRCSAALTSVLIAARHRPHAADGHAGRRARCSTSWPTSSTTSPAAPTACRASSSGRCSGASNSTSAARVAAYAYSLRVLFVVLRARAPRRPFAARRLAAGAARQPAAAVGDRHVGQRRGWSRSTRSRPALAGAAGALLAQTTRLRVARCASTSTAVPTCCWCS